MKPEPDRLPQDPPAEGAYSCLSALADGDASAADPACRLWRDDEQARRTWHTYHLIGDVMRSEDLAAAPARDAAFLSALRQRLAAEPVVLAPTPSTARRQPWLVPAAMVAGFVLVAGVLVVARVSLPGAPPAAVEVATASNAGSPALGRPELRPVPNGTLIIDTRLDEFLRAHQAAGGGMAAAAPGGTYHRVGMLVPAATDR